jgi:hypothetical protein
MDPSRTDILNLLESIRAEARRYGPTVFADYEAERNAARASPAPDAAKPMIYTLTVQCAWGPRLTEPCVRVIEIKDTATLFDLHFAIQKAVGFDNDHLFEFYAGRHYRKRAMVFCDTSVADYDANDMDEISLKRIWPLPKSMKLFYWFDFGDDWKFQVTKERAVRLREKGIKYPRVVGRTGPNPEQYPRDDW